MSDLVIRAEGDFEPIKRGLTDLQKEGANLGNVFQKTRAQVQQFAEAGTGIDEFKKRQLEAVEAVKLFELAIIKAHQGGAQNLEKSIENLERLKAELAAVTSEYNRYVNEVKKGQKTIDENADEQARAMKELMERRKELIREEVTAIQNYERGLKAERDKNIGEQREAWEKLHARRKELARLTVQAEKDAVEKIRLEEAGLHAYENRLRQENEAAWKALLERRKALTKAEADARAAYERRAQEAARKTRAENQALLGTLKSLAVGWLGIRLGNFISQTLEAAQAMERIRLALDTATGSAEKGAEAFEYARGISRQYGVDLQTTAKQLGLFTAATEGFGLKVEHSRYIFEAFTKASRALGLSADDLQGIFTALQQILSKGVVQMEELRQQLGDRLPGAINFFSKAIGIPIEQLFKLTQKGLVPANESMLLFAKTIDERFGPGVAKAMTGVQATITRVKNDLFELRAEFGRSFVMGATEGIKDLDQELQDLKESAGQSGDSLGRLAASVEPFIAGWLKYISILTSGVAEATDGIRVVISTVITGLAALAANGMRILEAFSRAIGKDDWAKSYAEGVKKAESVALEFTQKTTSAMEAWQRNHKKTIGLIGDAWSDLAGGQDAYTQALIETKVAQEDFDAAFAMTSSLNEKAQTAALAKIEARAIATDELLRKTDAEIAAAKTAGATEERMHELAQRRMTLQIELNKTVEKTLTGYEKLGKDAPPKIREIAKEWNIVSEATREHQMEVEKVRAQYDKDIFGGGIDQLHQMTEALLASVAANVKLGVTGPETMKKILEEARKLALAYREQGAAGDEMYAKLIAAMEKLGFTTDDLTKSNDDLKDSQKQLKESSKQLTDQFREQEKAAKAAADAAKSALEKATEALAETRAELAKLDEKPIRTIEEVNREFELRQKLPSQQRAVEAARGTYEQTQEDLQRAGIETDVTRWMGKGLEGEEIAPLIGNAMQLAGNEFNQQIGPVIGGVQGLGLASAEAADGVTQFVSTLQGYVQSGFKGALPEMPQGMQVTPTNVFGETPPLPFAQSGIGPMYQPGEDAKSWQEIAKAQEELAKGGMVDLTRKADELAIAMAEADQHTNTMWEGMQNIEESSYSAARALEATGESVVVINGVAMTMGQLADATELYGSFAPTAAEATQQFAEAGWDAGGAYNELTSQLELMYDRTGEVATVAERVGDVFMRWGEDGKITLTNFTAEMGLTGDEVKALGGTVDETTEGFEYWGKSVDTVAEILKLRANPQLSETEQFLQSINSGTTDLGEKGVESVGLLKTAWEEIKTVINEANELLRQHIALAQQAGGAVGDGAAPSGETPDNLNPGSIQ